MSGVHIHAGVLSEGTLLCHESFPKMLDCLRQLDWQEYVDFCCDEAAHIEPFVRRGTLTDGFGIAWEVLYAALDRLAHDHGHFFGAHPDDPAALGFWPLDWLE
jgi:hypothetical protein